MDIVEGDSIIMPIDMVSVAVIRSMTRKGSVIKKPISNPRRNSETMNAGMSVRSPGESASASAAATSFVRELGEHIEVFLPHIRGHELAERIADAVKCFLLRELVIHVRLEAALPCFVENRRHGEHRHEERQADKDNVCRRRRQAKTRPQERKRDDKAREACHHHKNARRHRQHRNGQNELNDPRRSYGCSPLERAC